MEYPTEAEYAEAFGVEIEGNGSEDGQEGGHTQEGQGEGQGTEMGVEAAEGAENGTSGGQQSNGTGEDAADGADGHQEGQPREMDPEERHRQAAARRAREEQARAAAVQARVDKIYADMFAGQTDPYTGKPITTEAEFLAYKAERERRQQDAQMQKAGIDPETIRGIVEQQMAPYRQQMERSRLAAIQQQARAVNAKAQAAIGTALKNISALDPNVKSLEDIAGMETAPRFNQLVQAGIGLEDAFYLANRQAIDARRAAAAKAAAQNEIVSKRHLNPVGASGGKTPVEVPKGVVEAYRAMMPEATDAEIQQAYEKAMKDMK